MAQKSSTVKYRKGVKVPKTEKLKFPVIKQPLPPAKWLSMDDYVEFVIFNLKYTVNKKILRKQKKLAAVNVPFFLR